VLWGKGSKVKMIEEAFENARLKEIEVFDMTE
jgi:hypothetical protein